MLKVAGVASLALAAVSIGAAVLCAAFVPEALRGEMREPEDVFAVFAWFLVSALLGSSLAVAGSIALRTELAGVGLRRASLIVLTVLAVPGGLASSSEDQSTTRAGLSQLKPDPLGGRVNFAEHRLGYGR
jgi:hypothetical protein